MPSPKLAAKPVVLLVDDDVVLRLVLREALSASGVDVTEASNGREALAVIHVRKPDVIITDIVMPEMDGITLLRHLGESPHMASFYIIAMSGTADESVRTAALELGAREFFDKTMGINGLMKKVRQVFSSDL